MDADEFAEGVEDGVGRLTGRHRGHAVHLSQGRRARGHDVSEARDDLLQAPPGLARFSFLWHLEAVG